MTVNVYFGKLHLEFSYSPYFVYNIIYSQMLFLNFRYKGDYSKIDLLEPGEVGRAKLEIAQFTVKSSACLEAGICLFS